jgi:FkbM family methyltransferase
MVAYIFRIFRTQSFRRDPVLTIYRALMWLLLYIFPKRRASIRIPVGDTSFWLNLPPLLRSAGSTGIFVQRQYYEPLLEFCDRLVKRGDVAFDCGANQGIYSCAFAAIVGPSGRVIAFEPQDYAVTALKNNLRINGFDNVTVEHAAVSDHEGSAILDVSRGATSASITRDFGLQEGLTVPTVTLAGIAERVGIERLDLLKMDIEGAEYFALSGSEILLTKYKPIIVLEATPSEAEWRKILTLLGRHGYAPHLFDTSGRLNRVVDLEDYQSDVIFLQCQ